MREPYDIAPKLTPVDSELSQSWLVDGVIRRCVVWTRQWKHCLQAPDGVVHIFVPSDEKRVANTAPWAFLDVPQITVFLP